MHWEIAPIDVLFVNHTTALASNAPWRFFCVSVSESSTGVVVLLSEIGSHYDSEEAKYHAGFDLPPFDLDLFNTVHENDLVPEPTAEVAALK